MCFSKTAAGWQPLYMSETSWVPSKAKWDKTETKPLGGTLGLFMESSHFVETYFCLILEISTERCLEYVPDIRHRLCLVLNSLIG